MIELDRIQEYCSNQDNCRKCRFYSKMLCDCMFVVELSQRPSDWDLDELEEMCD